MLYYFDMAKHKHHSHSFRFSVIAMLAIVTLPVTTHTLLGTVRSVQQERSQRILPWQLDQADLRAQRRAFVRARNRCLEKKMKDESVDCPDYSKPGAFHDFVKEYDPVATRASQRRRTRRSTTVTKAEDVDTSFLSLRDQAMLRQYTEVLKRCPARLRGRELYNLCKQILGEGSDTEAIVGLMNPKAYLRLHQSPPVENSIKNRLSKIREAWDRSNRRPDNEPMKPSASWTETK